MNQSKFAVANSPLQYDNDGNVSTRNRDILAAGGENPLSAYEQRLEKLRLENEADSRRRAREAAVAVGDETGAKICRWNNPAEFEQDTVAAHSEDIGGGQSHRAAMRARIANGELRDRDFDNDAGPSRRLLRQPNLDTTGKHYVLGGEVPRRSVSSTTPRGLQLAPIPTSFDSGRTPPARPSGHTRPPSPRSFGTTRYPGRVARPAGVPPLGQAWQAVSRPLLQGLATAPRTTAASSALLRSSPLASLSAARSARPSAAAAPTVPRPSLSATTAASRMAAAASATSATGPQAPLAPATAPGVTFQDGDQAASDAIDDATSHIPDHDIDIDLLRRVHVKALWQAANPGHEAAEFARSDPLHARCLANATQQLLKEATSLIKSMKSKNIDDYLNLHPERKWMIQAALKALQLLEDGSDQAIRDHYAEHRAHRAFYEAALVAHGSQRSLAQLSTSSASTLPAVGPSSPSASSASTVVPSSRAQPGLAQATSNGTQAQLGSSTASTIGGNENARVASTTLPSSAGNAQPCSQPIITNGATQPNGSISTASSQESLRSAATDITIPPTQGVMNVTLYDKNGDFLGHQQVQVAAPVNASLTVKSTAAKFDPRNFLASLGGGLERQEPTRHRGVEGAAQAADGIWEEAEDDEEL